MKAICTTTINPPTEALLKFAEIASRDDWHIYIAGDITSPHYAYQQFADRWPGRITYLHPDDQEKMNRPLSDSIGWKCIQRRNFAILAAYQAGAEILALVDDDNIPYEGWGKNLVVGTNVEADYWGVADVVGDPITMAYLTAGADPSHIWHRGYPVQLLDRKNDVVRSEKKIVTALVQADFWDGDPDIDAICRISNHPECNFDPNMWPFTASKPMPFNSQNTFIHRKVVPYYFLFPHIGRMDDIWAAYVVQARFPESVVFSRASVFQKRNDHDLVKDLKAEMIGYESTLKFVTALYGASEGEDKFAIMSRFIPHISVEAFRFWMLLTSR